jgi:predicted RNase H-like nuclease (RuvC/YqgF family)
LILELKDLRRQLSKEENFSQENSSLVKRKNIEIDNLIQEIKDKSLKLLEFENLKAKLEEFKHLCGDEILKNNLLRNKIASLEYIIE